MNFGKILEKLKTLGQYAYIAGGFIGALILILLLYWVLLGRPQPVDERIGDERQGIPVVSGTSFVEQLKRDLNLLTDPIFKNLRLPVGLPIRVTPPGRENPFSPF